MFSEAIQQLVFLVSKHGNINYLYSELRVEGRDGREPHGPGGHLTSLQPTPLHPWEHLWLQEQDNSNSFILNIFSS